MARGIRLKKTWRPGAHQGSIYDEVDNDHDLPHQQFMSAADAHLRLRRNLMDSDGSANLTEYNRSFRSSIEQDIPFVAAPESFRLAESNGVSDDLAFCKKLDQQLQAFERTLQDLINNRSVPHEEIDRLVAVYLEKLTEQFQDRQEAAYEKTWWQENISEATVFTDTALSTRFGDLYPFKTADTEAIRRLAPDSKAALHIQGVSQYLNNKINATRRLDDSLRLDLAGLELRAKAALPSAAALSADEVKALDKSLKDDLKEIEQLNRRYEADLFKAKSDLDNSALTIHNLNVVHEVYQRAILDKIDAFEREHGYTLWCNQTGRVKEGADPDAATTTHTAALSSKLSLVAQQRFAEIREHSLALRVRQNQQFMAPKSTLQDFRYGWDQDHQSKYDDATTGKAATFKTNADACYSALTAPELTAPKALPTPPTVTAPRARMALAPMKEPPLPDLPKGKHRSGMATEFHVKMQAFEKAKPEAKAGQHAELVRDLKYERDALSRGAAVLSVPDVTTYLNGCEAYLDYHSPEAIAKRLDEELLDLQIRIVDLLKGDVVNVAEVSAINTALAALTPTDTELAEKIKAATADVEAVDKYLTDKKTAHDEETLPDKQVDALQRRINALAEAYQGPTSWADAATEAKAISDGLAALKKGLIAPKHYSLHTLEGDASAITKADHANSFVKVPVAGSPGASTIYFVDENGAPTPVTPKGTTFLNRFPTIGDDPVELPAAQVHQYLPEKQAGDQVLATKIAKATAEVTAVQAYYPLAIEFKNTAINLTSDHEEYAAAARQLLDIEFNFEPTSARQQLDQLTKAYTAKCEASLKELTDLKAKIEKNEGSFPLTPDQKKNFNEQCVALEKLQKEHLAAATKEIQALRAEADETFERFNRNYQLDRLIQDPFNADPNYKLTEEQKKKLLDKDSDPERLLNRLLPPGGDAELQVGFMTLRRNSDGSYDIDLSDAFSGKGEVYEYGAGKVSFATAIRRWCSSGQRSRDIEATLTDPRRLDNLGIILQAIKDPKTNTIYHHCKEYDKDSYNKMKAVFLAAKAQGIGYDLEACFAKSFNYRRTWYGMKVKISPQEKAFLLKKMRSELAQYGEQLIDSKAINQSCRDLTLHGMQPGSPNLDAVTVQDLNSKDFMTATLLLSHADTNLEGRLAEIELTRSRAESGLTPGDADYAKRLTEIKSTDSASRVAAVDQSLAHLRNLNLKIVSGIAPAGGNHNGSSAAMLGLALEREHFVSLLDLKKQELAAIHAEIHRLEASGAIPAWDERLADLRQQAASATETLNQEYIHFNQLCRQYGCPVDRSGREVPQQLADRRVEVERRNVTVSGQDKELANGIVTALTSLDAPKPSGAKPSAQEQWDTVKQQAVALERLEQSHALSRSTDNPVGKPLIAILLKPAELAQPHQFINNSPFKERAQTIEARLCAAREEIAGIDAAGNRELSQAKKTLADLPDTAPAAVRDAATLRVTELEKKQAQGFLNAHADDLKTKSAGASALENAQLLQQYQKLDTNWQQARAELAAAEREQNRQQRKGVDPKSKEALALDLRVSKARDALTSAETAIKALSLPQSLTQLCGVLDKAQSQLKGVQAAEKLPVEHKLSALKTALDLDRVEPKAIATAPLTDRLARVEILHRSITQLNALMTATPEQSDEKRLLLNRAQTLYDAIIDTTKKDVRSAVSAEPLDPREQQLKIDKLTLAAKILDHSDPAIRAHAQVQDDRRLMAMAQREVASHLTYAPGLAASADKPTQASLWAELKAFVKGETSPAFGDRTGVFSSKDKTDAAQKDLAGLIELEVRLEDSIKSAAPNSPQRLGLEATLKETQSYRAALVHGLKADAIRVLRSGTHEECERVKDTFNAKLALDKETLPVSPHIMARTGTKAQTIVDAVTAKMDLGQDKVDKLNTTAAPAAARLK